MGFPAPQIGAVGRILGASAAGWSHTGDTSETKVASVAVPANAIGASGQLEIITLWSYPNNANNKTLRIRFGAANDLTGTNVLATNGVVLTTTTAYVNLLVVANRSPSSQVCFPGTGSVNTTTAAAPNTAAIDTTATAYVVFSAQCANAADTIKLESYLVRLIPGV